MKTVSNITEMNNFELETKLKYILNKTPRKDRRILILGVGNELLADDKAGLLVVTEIEKRREKIDDLEIKTISAGTTPENFFAEIRRYTPTQIIIIDAAQLDQSPGTIQIIDPEKIQWTTFSTHTFPLHLTVDYLQQNIGCEVVVIGIQPKTVVMDEKVSPEITIAVKMLAGTIIEVING